MGGGLTGVTSGVYKVVVTYTSETNSGKSYTAATGEKTFNVYDNLTTTVSGTVQESVQAATIKGEGIFSADATGTIPAADTKLKLEVNATPLGTDVIINETTTGKTSVEFPANSLTATSDESNDVKLTVKTTSIETADATYSVADNGATVAGFDLTLEGATIAEENDGIEITTYVVPGLDVKTLSIKYVEDESDKTATITSYDPETGLLTFKVKHFSEYILTTSESIAYDHNSLYAAIEEGRDVKLVCDITLKDGVYVAITNMTIDLNGKSITRSNNQFIFGYGNSFVQPNAEVTLKNGTLNSINEDTPITISTASLKLENMTINDRDTNSYYWGLNIMYQKGHVEIVNSEINVYGHDSVITGFYKSKDNYSIDTASVLKANDVVLEYSELRKTE